MVRLLILILCLSTYVPSVSAQADSPKDYTKDRPLVFEDSWNLWPYAYLNEEGKPEGYCIDLIEIIMRDLNIPYVIQLKAHQDVLKDLKARKADLALGLCDVYGVKFGLSGKNSVVQLTQSVVTPKRKPVAIKSFRDLKNQQVVVKDSGLCHQLMVDYGWGDHAISTPDIGPAMLDLNDRGEGQIVWNTLSLKWLIKRYQLNNLKLTPVDMPFGERKFMSNDQHLLDLVDSIFINLSAADKLKPLEEKWLYSDNEEDESYTGEWYLVGFALLLLIVAIILLVRKKIQNLISSKR